ncbi:hypothetical protein SK128_027355 [Halocaridina rubra]|uniref:Cytochrome oxidase complex assembly protein 1 n=1 Tax=Halocaridina rubra TaxID=373956 RepID=A0AAN8X3H0_HALRR
MLKISRAKRKRNLSGVVLVAEGRIGMLSTQNLARTAALGGFFVVGSGLYFKFRIQDGLKQNEYYKESLNILRSHRGIAHLLGEPIKDGNLNLGDNANNFSTATKAQFQVPVKGPQKAGTLYLWASRPDTSVKWNVDRLELGFKEEPNRRILILDSKKNE